jgi:hypothetical protein
MDNFKTFFKNCKDELVRGETLSQVLNSVGVTNRQIIRIERTFRMDPDMYAVTFIFKEPDDKNLQRGIVDVKHGEPNCQQMMDLSFGIGEGCDLRIAMFDGKLNELDDLDPESSQYYTRCFAQILNSCGKETHVARMRSGGKKGKFMFVPISMPLDQCEMNFSELPSKEDFERAEFWLFFYGKRYFGWKPRYLEPRFWFQEHSSLSSDNVELTSKWNEDGIHLTALFTLPMACNRFLRSFKAKLRTAWGSYNPLCMQIEEEAKNAKRLSVLLSELPFRNFVLAEEKEREELATCFDLAEQEFLYFIEEVIEENERRAKQRKVKATQR